MSVQPRDRGRYSFKHQAPPQLRLAPEPSDTFAKSARVAVAATDPNEDTRSEQSSPAATIAVELRSWRPDLKRPVPQAPELYRVALIADLVDRGATTTEALAGAMQVSYREANYYANAASYLKLINDSRDEGLAVFTPTTLGRAFARCDALTKAAVIRTMVRELPTTKTIKTDGVIELTKRLMTGGLSEATARRRAKAMREWADQAEQVADLIDAFETRCADALALAVMAKDVADAQRRTSYARLVRDASGSTPLRHREDTICPDCNQALPATGECGIC